jgi:predicted amidohydrolase YtcJ
VTGMWLRDVEVEGDRVDVRVVDDTIAEIGPGLARGHDDAAPTIDGLGGALIPGLWDHHLHLLAIAAAYDSVGVGPPAVGDLDALGEALRQADRDLPPGRWLRGVGYHETVAGHLGRTELDRLVADRPTRLQHRSGAEWILNSAAVDRLGLDRRTEPGIERDDRGRPTGRVYGLDDLVRQLDRSAASDAPDLARLGAELAGYGIVGVTDATPTETDHYFAPITAAVTSGALAVRVMVTGAPGLDPARIADPLLAGPAKIILADHGLPPLADLEAAIGQARRHGRAIAVHCVTRVALVLALAALEEVGAVVGDRIEHGGVIPPALVEPIAELGLTVVTQPGFIADRGDVYATTVDDEDLDDLYPAARLLAAGVALAASSDAPFGPLDPWHSMSAAVHRRTIGGLVLGETERLAPRRALDLFLGAGSAPGGPIRRVAVGEAADLCLLDRPLSAVLADPRADRVAATICAGRLTYRGTRSDSAAGGLDRADRGRELAEVLDLAARFPARHRDQLDFPPFGPIAPL